MRNFAILVLTICCCRNAIAAGIELTMVADIDTGIPGGDGNFVYFSWPSLDDENLLFSGRGSDDQEGIYRFRDGTIESVVDRETTFPDVSINLSQSWPTIDGQTIAFRGSSDGERAIYALTNGEIAKVADSTTPLPGGTGKFNTFGPPVISSGQIVFEAETSSGQGIYAYEDETLRTVADTTTRIPGDDATFQQFFGGVRIDDGVVLFPAAGSGRDGIYAEINGHLSSVVDDSAPGLRTIANFSSEEGSLVFRGIDDNGKHGLYSIEIEDSDSLQIVADADIFAPTLDVGFTFGRTVPTTANGAVAFWANTSDGENGIFLLREGELTQVVKSGELLDGKLITGVHGFSGHEFDGNRIGFIVSYSGGRNQAIYLATVPEPSYHIPLIVCSLVLVRHRKALTTVNSAGLPRRLPFQLVPRTNQPVAENT